MDAILDIFSLARNLYGSHLATPRDYGRAEKRFDTPNIFQRGVDLLEDRVRDFNNVSVRDNRIPDPGVDSPFDTIDDSFANIDDFFDLGNADSVTLDRSYQWSQLDRTWTSCMWACDASCKFLRLPAAPDQTLRMEWSLPKNSCRVRWIMYLPVIMRPVPSRYPNTTGKVKRIFGKKGAIHHRSAV